MLLETLSSYKRVVDCAIEEAIDRFPGPDELRTACAWALRAGGKRIRPAIILAVSKAIGNGLEPIHAALSVEFHHTASLIADDLPCMDDDLERRGQPCCHIQFGETTALLASYALIAAGYEELTKASLDLAKAPAPICLQADEACRLSVENVSQNTGLHGIIGGQFLDLNPSPEALQETLLRKTGALFETSFLLGWLFGGGSLEQTDNVKRLGLHFGTIFQIVDDFLDLEEDRTAGRVINAPLLLGEEEARRWLVREKEAVDRIQKELRLHSEELTALSSGLLEMVV